MEQTREINQSVADTEKTIPSVAILANGLAGCGALTACKIIVEIEDITRFQTEAKLAKYAGIAPVQD